MSLSFDDESAIHRLLVRYCFYLDQRRLAELAQLFAEDGTWETHFAKATGPAAIHSLLEEIIPDPPARRHFVTNILIDATKMGASSECYYYVIRDIGNGPQVTVAGTYFDSFVRTAEEWRFAHRRLSPAIVGDLGLKPTPAS